MKKARSDARAERRILEENPTKISQGTSEQRRYLALYQDARGQILFKDKVVALDYIQAVEAKAAKI